MVMVGGFCSRNTSDEDVLTAAHFAVERLNDMSNSLHPHKLDSVLEASSQVVAGTNYSLLLQTTRGNSVEKHEVIVFKSLSQQFEFVNHKAVSAVPRS
ncbi:hypothetical protein RCL1_002486 [Eukaryota sp. TZLM3-RCL]